MVAEAAQVVEVVVEHTITMEDMVMVIAMGTIVVTHQEAVHQDGLLVESSAVYSAASSVLFSARMEHAKDVVSAAKQKGKDHIIKIL